MDAKTRDLALFAALSLFCTGFAWSWGYVILGSVFFTPGAASFPRGVAILDICWTRNFSPLKNKGKCLRI
jgi:hypothetical protein